MARSIFGDWLENYGFPSHLVNHNQTLDSDGFTEAVVNGRITAALLESRKDLTDHSNKLPGCESLNWLRGAINSKVCFDSYGAWVEASKECESPIEALAFLTLCAVFTHRGLPVLIGEPMTIPCKPQLDERMVAANIVLQELVAPYRIDIAIHAWARVGGQMHLRKIAVECDGWEYHKDRHEQDAAKDAFLKTKRFTVFRYPGVLIWHSVQEIAFQILDHILDHFKPLIQQTSGRNQVNGSY